MNQYTKHNTMSESSTNITDWRKLTASSIEKVDFDNYSNEQARYEMWVSPTDNPQNPLIAIGLNPCGKTDDVNFSRTTDNLRRIAFNNHYDGLIILNLCPVITDRASELRKKDMGLKDSAHQENLKHIRHIAERYKGSDVLLCFGKAIVKQHLAGYLNDIYSVLHSTNKDRRFFRINASRNGKPYDNPPHPSRISPNTPLEPMDVEGYINELCGTDRCR